MEWKDNQLANCNFTKTVMMLVIVLFHSMLYWRGDWFNVIGTPVYEAKALEVITRYLSLIVNSTFVLVSGYVFYYVKEERRRYNGYKAFLSNKLKRLIVPCYFGIIFSLPFILYYRHFSMKDIVVKLILGTAPSHLWFLMMLFGVFAIAYPLSKIWKVNDFLGILSVVLLYAIGSMFSRLIGDYFQVPAAMQYTAVFFVGYKLRQNNLFNLNSISLLVLIPSDFLIYFLYRIVAGKEDSVAVNLGSYLLRFGHLVTGSLMAFVLLQTIATHVNWKSKWFNRIMECSFPIYLFHHPLIWVLLDITNGTMNPYLNVIIVFFVSLAVSLFLSVGALCIPLLRFCLGEKPHKVS